MLKGKGKILVTLMLVLLFGALFATMAFALEGENITITFYTSGNTVDKSINTNGIVEGEISLSGGQTLTLPTKGVEEGKSFNWRTADGQAWEGGTTVKFYESTSLYPVTAIDISTAEQMYELMPKGSTVRLMNDIYLDKKPDFPWPGTCYVLLNGRTLEINSSIGTAWGGQRSGTYFYGTGTVKYLGSGLFMDLRGHGWGGDCCRLYVGKGVTLNAPNSVLGSDGDQGYVQGYPYITIDGTVICKTVLRLTHSGNRNPRLEINKSGQLVYTEALILNTVVGNTAHVLINGGTVYAKSTSISFFNDSTTTYEITGGSFKFSYAKDIENLFSNVDIAKYRIIDLMTKDGTAYKAVIDMECQHEFILHTTLDANCNNPTTDVFRCEKCEADLRIISGNTTEHKLPETPTDNKVETPTERGWNKYICECCFCASYEYIYYDPTDDLVTVIVDTGSGKTEVQAVVKNVFVVDSTSALTGVKDFKDDEGNSYTANQIVGIYVPVGISAVNIKTSNAYVKEIVLGKNLNATITSLTSFTALEKITVEDVIYVKFAANCSPTALKSIEVKNIPNGNRSEIEFAANAFSGRTNLTELTLVSNADYIFGEKSFFQTGVKSVVFPDYCKVEFKGPKAFSEAKTEYVYFGKGITEIKNYPFDDGWYLQTVILMDVTQLNDWAFSRMNKGPNVPVVYHHASTLSLGANTFAEGHGVIVYTKATLTTGFASCKEITKNGVTYPAYTIYYGICHEFERVEKLPTCTEEGSIKYITTCPCGVNDGSSCKVFHGTYTNGTETAVEDYTDKIKDMLPHDMNDVEGINYVNGYTKPGYGVYKCSVCSKEVKESEPTCAPLVRCLGYSVPNDDGTRSITVKYVINKVELEKYEAANGVTLEYGVVVVAKSSLNDDQTPLDENGNVIGGAIKYQISNGGYTSGQIKLSNIGQDQSNESFVLCTYIKKGNEIAYIQDNETVKNPSGVSYKEIKELSDYLASLSKRQA